MVGKTRDPRRATTYLPRTMSKFPGMLWSARLGQSSGLANPMEETGSALGGPFPFPAAATDAAADAIITIPD